MDDDSRHEVEVKSNIFCLDVDEDHIFLARYSSTDLIPSKTPTLNNVPALVPLEFRKFTALLLPVFQFVEVLLATLRVGSSKLNEKEEDSS